ncbi:acetolactate synthase large subunit [Aureimonas leprariae]|uniref:Acetolactate synthase large subunit n=1 Tax=Plantimonas leprariae TaxID=2615207 RepID=A0A7V7PM26_9HYPH|nr:acetolactate synthase large subunit [Aureimonas leprariae]KAB0677576.1 acetolactate synthase large subunit [Aureimonas leprariae]
MQELLGHRRTTRRGGAGSSDDFNKYRSKTVKAADLFVCALQHEGVEVAFGVPGEENIDLIDAFRRSTIRLVITRHEQTAAFMAATFGRLTGRAGVCFATLGPGALNLTTPAAYALLGGMPLVMVTGQRKILSSREGHFQSVDVIATMTPLTKASRRITNGDGIPSLVRDAFRVAERERPGPVHLELPEDVAAETVDALPLLARSESVSPIAASEMIDQAADLIVKADAPLLMVGASASRPGLSEALSDFVRRVRIPFFNTQMGKGAVSCASDLYMGTAALTERDYVHRAIDDADLIVAIGHDTVEKPPFIMDARRSKVLHVGHIPAAVEEVYFPAAELVGDIGRNLRLLADRVEGKLPRADALLHLREDILARVANRADESRFPLTPQRIVHDVRKAMPKDGIVCLDNGIYKIWFARNYRTDVANTLLLDNALATMGAGLPSAMAAAMVHPERHVLAVCGDGGFMMNAQDLETAIRLGINLVVLIIRDDGYGMIRWKQAVEGLPEFGATFGNPDFDLLAKAHGASGTSVVDADGLVPALVTAFQSGGVHVVTVPVDYSENLTVLVDELCNDNGVRSR